MAKRVIDWFFEVDREVALEGWAQSQLIGIEDFAEAAPGSNDGWEVTRFPVATGDAAR